MTELFPSILALHIAAGLAACLIGLVPILTTKGSRLHRWAGRLFVIVTTAALVAAWAMTALHFSSYLLTLTATATFHVFSGVRVLGRKRPDLRVADRARAIDWIAAVGVFGVGLWVFSQIFAGRSDGPAAVSGGLAFAAVSYGAWDLWRFARPKDWPFSPNLWTCEHLAKMLSAYSALLSAFSGNFLTVLPAPWSQLWPSLLFPLLSVIWIMVLIGRWRAVAMA
ncbi:MAG: hypothetical protein RL093_920 [Pseudomonadota bacterium]|jgi:uncharacterized membrane protein